MSYKEAKKNYRDAKVAYENNPTIENEVAMMGAKEVVVMMVAVMILAYLLGPAITALVGINTTGWPEGASSLILAVPIIIIAVVIMKFL